MTTYELTEAVAVVEHATSVLDRIRGLMFRDVPEEETYALVHDWGRVAERNTHMIGARSAADVYWLVDGTVVSHERLRAWSGSASHDADALVQVVGGAPFSVGDNVTW